MLKSKKALVVGAGGGNDSFSSLLLLSQIKHIFDFSSARIDVAAMLPSCLNYKNIEKTNSPNLFRLTSQSQRFAGELELKAFPERVLCQLKDLIPFGIENVFGVNMQAGSQGVLEAFSYLLAAEQYDFILVADVGGDFIAVDENIAVLSPQMDGYAGYAFKQLEQKYSIVYGVFGLATDGESSPEMLKKALQQALPYQILEGSFELNDTYKKLASLYREHVEPNRYSRTTDFTLKEISLQGHENPSKFRCRFHVKNSKASSEKFYAYFEHFHDEQFYGKYYLFSSLNFVNNRFCVKSANSLEWISAVHSHCDKVNHELCGQEEDQIFYCLPSFRFVSDQRNDIVNKTLFSLSQGLYSSVVFYKEDLFSKNLNGFNQISLNSNLMLLKK